MLLDLDPDSLQLRAVRSSPKVFLRLACFFIESGVDLARAIGGDCRLRLRSNHTFGEVESGYAVEIDIRDALPEHVRMSAFFCSL